MEKIVSTVPPSYLWLLNPDAEGELAAKNSYTVKSAFVRRISERKTLFDELLQGDDSLFSHQDKKELCLYSGRRALCWSPTPLVVHLAQAAGLLVPKFPDVKILKRVFDKRFISNHLQSLVITGRTIIETQHDWVQFQSANTGVYRLKRPYGYAGKGQRLWSRDGSKDDKRWLADSLRQGGFIAEKNLTNVSEYSIHGFVDERGIILGKPCHLRTDAYSAPTSIEALTKSELEAPHFLSLSTLATKSAQALHAAGYFGPFGLDVLEKEGKLALIDLNPRFTLGWSQGMGALREDALGRALAPLT